MIRQCACIDTLYTELPWLERFQAARDDGFVAVEFWDWRIRDLDATREAAEKAGIIISGFNGDNDYSLVDPAQKQQYLEALEASCKAAKQVGAESVTIHSNALGDGGVVVNHYTELSHTVKLCAMFDTLKDCAAMAEKYGIDMNLEALNVLTDHVGNFLETTQMGAEMLRIIVSKTTSLIPFSRALFAITVPTYAAAALSFVFSSSALISFSTVEAATSVLDRKSVV